MNTHQATVPAQQEALDARGRQLTWIRLAHRNSKPAGGTDPEAAYHQWSQNSITKSQIDEQA